jgi:hypothetical protein
MGSDPIRAISSSIAASAGILIPSTLPLLDAGSLRNREEIVDRLLVLTAVAATSYGFDRSKALAWLAQEKLDGLLTQDEALFLKEGKGREEVFQVQIEGMWALAWCIALVQDLDFWQDCDSQFVSKLPNLKVGESGRKLRDAARLRPLKEVFAACDLAYCLHWALRQAEIDGARPPGGLKHYVVVERRRALEWTLGSDSWDAVSLDT